MATQTIQDPPAYPEQIVNTSLPWRDWFRQVVAVLRGSRQVGEIYLSTSPTSPSSFTPPWQGTWVLRGTDTLAGVTVQVWQRTA